MPNHEHATTIPHMAGDYRLRHSILADLQPVILGETEESRVSRATAALYEQLADQFSNEEDIAAHFSPEAVCALKCEHGHMMEMVTRLRAMPYGHKDARQLAFLELTQALFQHDAGDVRQSSPNNGDGQRRTQRRQHDRRSDDAECQQPN